VYKRQKKARLRSVKVGHSNGLSTEILSGLSEGERVITHPDDTIRDGTRVQLNGV
jgi:HlyD family secretion protein